jgi:short-subunit dehydrogenase
MIRFLLSMVLVGVCCTAVAHDKRKVVLITGNNRSNGIGFAMTEHLLRNDIKVISVVRKPGELYKLQSAFPGQLDLIIADLSTSEGQNSVVQQIKVDKLDYIVHNAFFIGPIGEKALFNGSIKELRDAVQVNLIAPIVITNQLSSKLHRSSRILVISSDSGDQADPGLGINCITKAAIDRYVESLQLDLKHKVLVTSVHPGAVSTDTLLEISKPNIKSFSLGKKLYSIKSSFLDAPLVGKYLTWLLLHSSNSEFGKRKHSIYDREEQNKWNKNNPILIDHVCLIPRG